MLDCEQTKDSLRSEKQNHFRYVLTMIYLRFTKSTFTASPSQKKTLNFQAKSIRWQKHLDESDKNSNSAGCRWWKLRRLLHPCEVRDCKPTELFHKVWSGRCHPQRSPSMQTLDLKTWKKYFDVFFILLYFSRAFTHVTHLTILPCHNDFTAQV